MSFWAQNFAKAMQMLSDNTNKRVSGITNHIADKYEISAEKSESSSPNFELFHNVEGFKAIKSRTSFTPLELIKIWMAVSAFVSAG